MSISKITFAEEIYLNCTNIRFLIQQGGGNSGKGKGGGNTASQGIGQSQSSNQKSGVVSGGNTAGSGNNVNTQSQNNTGSTLSVSNKHKFFLFFISRFLLLFTFI